MDKHRLETARLVLRPAELDDLAWIRDEINTPGMMRHLGGAVRSLDELRAGLEADLAAFASGDYLRWTACLRVDGTRVGRLGLFKVRSVAAPDLLRGQPEIGWTLAEAFQGQGYASEAARALLDFGFRELGYPVIWSQTSDSNQASTRMMARLGFGRRADFDYVDPDYPAADNPTTVYSLARADWGQA